MILVSIVLLSFKNYSEKYTATWYDLHGRPTASGEIMDRNKATAACNSLPLDTKILVTNIENNRKVVVVITDRMGIKTDNRIDLSFKAFGKIADREIGKIKVKIKILKLGKHDKHRIQRKI